MYYLKETIEIMMIFSPICIFVCSFSSTITFPFLYEIRSIEIKSIAGKEEISTSKLYLSLIELCYQISLERNSMQTSLKLDPYLEFNFTPVFSIPMPFVQESLPMANNT